MRPSNQQWSWAGSAALYLTAIGGVVGACGGSPVSLGAQTLDAGATGATGSNAGSASGSSGGSGTGSMTGPASGASNGSSGAGSSSGAPMSGSPGNAGSGSSAGASSGLGGTCTSDSECQGLAFYCSFPVGGGCAALGSCALYTGPGPVCGATMPTWYGCGCDGTDVYLGCGQAPSTSASARTVHQGRCTDGSVATGGSGATSGSTSGTSSGSASSGCVDNVLCAVDKHWDSALCTCVPNSSGSGATTGASSGTQSGSGASSGSGQCLSGPGGPCLGANHCVCMPGLVCNFASSAGGTCEASDAGACVSMKNGPCGGIGAAASCACAPGLTCALNAGGGYCGP